MNFDLSTDLADLDIGDIGSWHGAAKALCFAVIAAMVLALGYLFLIADKRAELAGAEQREIELHQELAQRGATAAGLPTHRANLYKATATLTAMVHRLPVVTEVPGLVEDITRAARDNDLAVDRIDLADERQADLYRELPIVIGVVGDYHDIGAFAGDIAGLSRLVTLHDFEIAPRAGPRNLAFVVEARTYRYTPESRLQPRTRGAMRDRAPKVPDQ